MNLTVPAVDDRVQPPDDTFAWQAPAHWAQIDFISDLHLAPSLPRTVEAWRRHLQDSRADALVILGDLFEVWVGDDARFDDFEAECTAWLHAASRHRTVAFMAGNRDFLLGADMAAAAGLTLLPDPTVLSAWGERLLLTHGDAWCLDDVPYQRFRQQVRGAEWQADFLSRPLPERREQARQIRAESQRLKQQQVSTPSDWVDVDRTTAVACLQRHHCHTLVHGHTHRPATETLAPGLTRHVLSDWDLDDPQQPRANVLEWRPGALQARALHATSPA
ncbi:MAG: UDP-2,3-diacylglucosamine diphosphatase [Pseudomonadota bacterium]